MGMDTSVQPLMCTPCARQSRAPRYDKASQVAKKAHKEGTTLIQAGGPEGLGFFTADQFAEWVKPEQMVRPSPRK